MEFIQPAFVLTEDEAALVTALASASAAVGEPWFSYFEPPTVEEHLRHCGFTGIVHCGPEEAEATPGRFVSASTTSWWNCSCIEPLGWQF